MKDKKLKAVSYTIDKESADMIGGLAKFYKTSKSAILSIILQQFFKTFKLVNGGYYDTDSVKGESTNGKKESL